MAKAVAITAGLVLCVPAVDALGVFEEEAVAQPAQAGIDAQAIIGDGNPEGLLKRMESAATSTKAVLPPEFAREISLPLGCRDLRVDASGTVVSCIVDSESEAVADAVSKRMEERGWREVSLGSVEGATYVKDEGSCAWALVTCAQAGDATAVVYRCVYR